MCAGGPAFAGMRTSIRAAEPPVSAPANKIVVWNPRKSNDFDAFGAGGRCVDPAATHTTSALTHAVNIRAGFISPPFAVLNRGAALFTKCVFQAHARRGTGNAGLEAVRMEKTPLLPGL